MAVVLSHRLFSMLFERRLSLVLTLLIALNPQDEEVMATAEKIYRELGERGVEVFFDDRKERPGVKFKDADLIGLPLRVVVGKKGLAEGKVEISERRDREKSLVAVGDVVERVVAWAKA